MRALLSFISTKLAEGFLLASGAALAVLLGIGAVKATETILEFEIIPEFNISVGLDFGGVGAPDWVALNEATRKYVAD